MYHKKAKYVDQQVWSNLGISEAKVAMHGLFPVNIVLLRGMSAIIDYDVLCTSWVTVVDAWLTEKPAEG